MERYFFKLLLISFFLVSNAIALHRNYEAEEYCCLHQNPSDRLNLIEKYLSIIPSSSGFCLHIECSQCNDTWIEYYLHDNYDEEEEGEEWTEFYWNCRCKEKLLNKKFDRYWSCWMPNWIGCSKLSIYDGYLSPNHTKYFSFFNDYLQYVDKNKFCTCFWPEISKKAAVINNTAYDLFKKLFKNTELKNLVVDLDKQKDFFLTIPDYGFSLHGVSVYCVCQSFFYSDYDWICRDIDFYCSQNFEEKAIAKIRHELDEIRENLALLFLDVYQECLKKHPHERIKQELYLVYSDLNLPFFDIDSLHWALDSSHDHENNCSSNLEHIQIKRKFVKKGKRRSSNKPFCYRNKIETIPSKLNIEHISYYLDMPSPPKTRTQSNVYLSLGTFYNELNLYEEAIETLTQGIHLNPSNRDAYIERAMAYFETNQLPLALKDYEIAKKLITVPPFKLGSQNILMMTKVYIPEDKIDFSKGLLLGTLNGAKVSAVEFFPSIFSSCRGILNGLWAFVCSPIEVSQELVNTAYAIGEFIGSHSTEECFQCVVPELKELSLTWNKLNDYYRGQKIGYIIGKYGVDIFAPAGMIKGVNKVKALKRANTMATLESCAASQTKQTIILEESAKRATARATLLETAKNGKILVKNSNVKYHIMQKKHAWDKVVIISGNVEEDFAKIIALLEENNILDKTSLVDKPQLFPKNSPRISKAEYEKIINNNKIHVEFETYLENGETFIKDAWVITK